MHHLVSSSTSTTFITDLQHIAPTGKVVLTATQHYCLIPNSPRSLPPSLKIQNKKFKPTTSIICSSSSKYLINYQQQQTLPELEVEINISKGNGLPQIFSGFKSGLEHS